MALRELPDGVRREVADTTDPAAAKRLIDRIAGEVGPPDVLVNTIGAFRPGDALTTTPETLRLMIDVNLGPALWLSQAVAPHMQQQGSGAIVHVAARPGIEPTGGMAAYSVSKAALVHLTRILDIELRPHGIRVNAVAPQLLDTPANRATFPAGGDGARGRAGGDRRRDRIPRQRRRSAGERSDTAGVRRLRRPAQRRANHQDPVTTSHLPGGEPGSVAKARTAARGRAPRFQGDTVTSPASGATAPQTCPTTRRSPGPRSARPSTTRGTTSGGSSGTCTGSPTASTSRRS